MIRFACPGCSAVLDVPDKAVGKKGRCPKCGQRLQIPASSSSPRDRTVLGINAAVESAAGSDFPVSASEKDWRRANADASPSETSPDWMDSDDGPAKMPKGTKIAIVSLGLGVLAIALVGVMVFLKAKGHGLAELPLQLTSPSSSLTEVGRNALLLHDAGEWHKAFSVKERAITDEPSRASHWYTRGILNSRRGDYAKAVHDFETTLGLRPDWQEANKLRDSAIIEWAEDDLRHSRDSLARAQESLRSSEAMTKSLRMKPPERDAFLESAREDVRRCKEEVRRLEDAYRRLKAGQ